VVMWLYISDRVIILRSDEVIARFISSAYECGGFGYWLEGGGRGGPGESVFRGFCKIGS